MLIYLYMDIPGIWKEHVLYAAVPRWSCVHMALKHTDTHPPVDAMRVCQPHDHGALKTGFPLPDIQSAQGSEPAGEVGITRSCKRREERGQWNERAGL